MTTRLLFFSLLLVISAGCDSVDSGFEVDLDLGTFDTSSQTLPFELMVDSEQAISEIKVQVYEDDETFSSGDLLYSYISTPTDIKDLLLNELIFVGDFAGDMVMIVDLTDVEGFSESYTWDIAAVQDEKTLLQLTFKLKYQDEPLVLFTDYAYPDGSTITFTRYSTYISGLRLGDDYQSDQVVYAPVSANNTNETFASAGYPIQFAVEPGVYEGFSMALGIDADLNAMRPADFPSGHPLADSGEYWLSWRSYVFTKIEGTIDANSDGIVDQSFALHLGGNDAYSRIGSDMVLDIEPQDVEMIDLQLDLYEWFTTVDNGPYDLFEDGSIHSLSHQPLIDQLLGNYPLVFNFE